jgi:hypothetical protein
LLHSTHIFATSAEVSLKVALLGYPFPLVSALAILILLSLLALLNLVIVLPAKVYLILSGCLPLVEGLGASQSAFVLQSLFFYLSGVDVLQQSLSIFIGLLDQDELLLAIVVSGALFDLLRRRLSHGLVKVLKLLLLLSAIIEETKLVRWLGWLTLVKLIKELRVILEVTVHGVDI